MSRIAGLTAFAAVGVIVCTPLSATAASRVLPSRFGAQDARALAATVQASPTAKPGLDPQLSFHAMTPTSLGHHGLGSGDSRQLTLPTSAHGLPARSRVSAVALSVTASSATASTTISLSGSGGSIHVVSGRPHATVTGSTVVPVSDSGHLTIHNSTGHTSVGVDVTGWFGTAAAVDDTGDTFHPLGAATVLSAQTIKAGHPRAVRIVGARRTGLPSNGRIAAVALGIDVAGASKTTAISAYPTHGALTKAPAVSAGHGAPAAGLAAVSVGHDGKVTLRNAHGTAVVAAAVEGYWTADAAGGDYQVNARPSTVVNRRFGGNQWTTVPVVSAGAAPAGVSAVAVEVTAAATSKANWVILSRAVSGSSASLRRPANSPAIVDTVVGLDHSGRIHVYTAHTQRLRLRILGWSSAPASGYDVSCGTIPSGGKFLVVAVTGGKPYDGTTFEPNRCFDADDAAATERPVSPQYYLNLADPGHSSDHWDKGGPKHCNKTIEYDAGCAYDYGYEAAKASLAYATAHGAVTGARWWVDVETDNSWAAGSDGIVANVADIRGALAYLDAHHSPAGVYTETTWWSVITGDTHDLSDVPVWGGGAGTHAYARDNCKAVSITGGPALLAQWFATQAGPDHDIIC